MTGTIPEALTRVLARAQGIGLIGPGPVDGHIRHARAYAGAWTIVAGSPSGPDSALDLGSGGGIPGLALALSWPHCRWVLLDSRRRSTEFLTEAISDMGLSHRITAVLGRAEDLGRQEGLRGAQDLVVARGFGPPPATAECAAPFLRAGGWLIVSEPPPPARERWDEKAMASLGLGPGRYVQADGLAFHAAPQDEPSPGRFPRRTGIPEKRPLF